MRMAVFGSVALNPMTITRVEANARGGTTVFSMWDGDARAYAVPGQPGNHYTSKANSHHIPDMTVQQIIEELDLAMS